MRTRAHYLREEATTEADIDRTLVAVDRELARIRADPAGAHGAPDDIRRVTVAGDVTFVGEGRMVRP